MLLFILFIIVLVIYNMFFDDGPTIHKKPSSTRYKSQTRTPTQRKQHQRTEVDTPINDWLNPSSSKTTFEDLISKIPKRSDDSSLQESSLNLFDQVIDSVSSQSHQSLSTTRLGKALGLPAKPTLFEFFLKNGYLTQPGRDYILTEKGIEAGGEYMNTNDGSRFVVWNLASILPHLKELLQNAALNYGDFKSLYHLTHINNLQSILTQGLLNHSAGHQYRDVSNRAVNARRQIPEPVHNEPIHNYVPFYFNVKNAMLYKVQAECESNVIILEMYKTMTCLPYTIFSDQNAATNQAKFIWKKHELNDFSWSTIYSDQWNHNGIANVSIKQKMMAECLVYQHVPASFIYRIHCQDYLTQRHVEAIVALSNHKNIEVLISPDRFFV